MSPSNVFINFPFDSHYKPLLDALLFTIISLGFKPCIMETTSSSDSRLQKIKELIGNSKFGIHDISRCRVTKHQQIPRFNMPFELGIEIGCTEFGNSLQNRKKILILEKEKYFYQKVISDISGLDIEDHSDKQELLIEKIRNWFSKINPSENYPPQPLIWNSFVKFYSNFHKSMEKTNTLNSKFSIFQKQSILLL